MYEQIFNLEQFLLLFVIFATCTIGALAKNLIDLWLPSKKKRKIELTPPPLYAVIVISLVLSVLSWAFSEYVINWIGLKPFIGSNVIVGLTSQELITKLSSLMGLKTLINDFMEFKESKDNNKNR